MLRLLIILLIASMASGQCEKDSDCHDVLGTYCHRQQAHPACKCRHDHPIAVEKRGAHLHCFKPMAQVGDLCWISAQCLPANTDCMRPSHRILSEIWEQFESKFIVSNGSDKYIPGRCTCNYGYREAVEHSATEAHGHPLEAHPGCVKRGIGSICKTSYECSSLTKYSHCQDKQCECFKGHIYIERLDRCVKLDAGITFCHDDDKFCPSKEAIASVIGQTMTNLIGFLGSMTLMSLLWIMFWHCNRDPSDGNGGSDQSVPASRSNFYFPQSVVYDETDGNESEFETLPGHEEDVLPTYDEAVKYGDVRKTKDQAMDYC